MLLGRAASDVKPLILVLHDRSLAFDLFEPRQKYPELSRNSRITQSWSSGKNRRISGPLSI